MTSNHVRPLQDANPWKGLNFYLEGEKLYGRDNEIMSLAQYITNNTQTVLYGKSGIGKSSIINAGIFPIARREGLYPIPIRLKHDKGSSYVAQVKSAFLTSGIGIKEIVPVINEKNETLWEYFHRHTFYNEKTDEMVRPLVVFDQFEEIFTLQHDENKKKAFFSQLADLLNEVTPQYILDADNKSSSIPEKKTGLGGAFVLDFGTDSADDVHDYIPNSQFNLVFTIREDFLSYLERYTAYIPVMKSNRYALLPINEEQAADIIMKPQEGLVSKDVAELIIQKVTGLDDFKLDGIPEIEVDAAVLSLYLSRLYIKKGSASCITAELVNQFSDDIIKDFYEESVRDLPEKDIEEIEDQLLTYDGRRNNVSRNDLIREGVSENVIRTLVEDKKLLRQFSYQEDIRVEFMHDILCPIVDARINQRESIRQQEEERKRQEAEKARLDAEHKELIRQQQRDRKRFRRTLLWSAVIVLLLVGAYFSNEYWNHWEYKEYYTSFVRQNGWPVGVGEPLDESKRKHLTVFYRLSREGRNPSHPFSQVDICSSTEVVIPSFRSPLVGTNEKADNKADVFASLNMEVRTIRFAAESDANDAGVSRELYYDDKEQLLYAINYYRAVEQNTLTTDQSASSMWAVYVDKNGLPLKVRDNGADRMKVFLSSSDDEHKDKLETKYMFYDEKGSPQSNDIGCYGFRIVYNDDLTTDSLFHLDPFSLENMVEVRTYNGRELSTTYYSVGRGNRQAIHEKLGYAKRVEIRDERGNIIERDFFDEQGQPASGGHYAKEQCHYDIYNRLDSLSLIDKDNHQISYTCYSYVGKGNTPTEQQSYSLSGGTLQLIYAKIRRITGNVTDNIDDDRAHNTYRHEKIVQKDDGHEIEYSYLDRTGQLVFDTLQQCCRYTEKSQPLGEGVIRVKRYYNIDGTLYSSPSEARVPAIDSAYYDKDGLRRSQVTKDAYGNIITSMGYDYKDGVEITRYVLSLDGQHAIRCPQWEVDGLCYYKLNNVKNAQTGFNLAYIQAVSEYDDCPSLIYFYNRKGTVDYAFAPTTMTIGEQWLRQENISISIPDKPLNSPTVQYIHITNLKGSAYQAGLRDGDLLLEQKDINQVETLITVIRYENGKWEHPNPFRIVKANQGMEIYPVAYTEKEYNEYLKGRNSR